MDVMYTPYILRQALRESTNSQARSLCRNWPASHLLALAREPSGGPRGSWQGEAAHMQLPTYLPPYLAYIRQSGRVRRGDGQVPGTCHMLLVRCRRFVSSSGLHAQRKVKAHSTHATQPLFSKSPVSEARCSTLAANRASGVIRQWGLGEADESRRLAAV